MNKWIQKRSFRIGGLLREPTLLILLAAVLLVYCGMGMSVSAEPLLSAGDPFAQTEPPADATMLIEVQEYTAPPPEARPALQNEDRQESLPAPKADTFPQQPEASAIPEPSSLLLVGVGILVGLGLRRRIKK